MFSAHSKAPAQSPTLPFPALCLLFAVMAAACFYQLHGAGRGLSIALYLALASLGTLYALRFGLWRVLAFPLLVTIVFIASITDLSPIGTRVSRDADFALRQWMIFAGLIPCALAMALCLGDLEARLSNLFLALSIISLTGFTSLIYLQTNQAGMTSRVFIINNLYTIEVLRIYFWAMLLMRAGNLGLRALMLAIYFALAFSIQAQVVGIALIAVMVLHGSTQVRRTILILALLGICLIALNHQVLMSVEHNIGARALFWHHAMQEVLLTGGIGVGLGAESIPRFYVHDGAFRTFTDGVLDHLHVIGLHNAFFQFALNLGLIGVGLLIYLFWCLAKVDETRQLPISESRLFTFAFVMLLVSCCVNTAIDSPNFINGTAFLMSRCIYRAGLFASANTHTNTPQGWSKYA